MKAESFNRFVRRVTELPSYLGGRLASLESWLQAIGSQISNLNSAIARVEDLVTRRVDQTDAMLARIEQKTETSLARTETNLSRIEASFRGAQAVSERRLYLQTPWKPEDRELASDPEFGLMAMLYSFLPSRIALDVGANVGRLSKLLLEAGFIVYAFEPFPKAYDQMMKMLAGSPDFKGFSLALGSKEGMLPLHIATGSSEGSGDPSLYNTFTPHSFPEGITLDSAVEVPVKTVKGLVEASVLPSDIGLVKIDTEGFDFEVIAGFGDLRPPIVVTEFWGDDFILVKDRDADAPGHPTKLLNEMRGRGYCWSLILFRVNDEDSSDVVRFTCNSLDAPRNSWGNIFFFRDYEPFIHALRWCSLVLPGLI